MSIIDIHTHLHPPRLFRAIRRWFAEHSDWNLSHPTEPEAVARSLRDFGVERFVFCSYAHKAGMAREINQWLSETSRKLDRYGLPLATVHVDDPDAAQYYEEALNDGCVGLKIHEDVQKFAIDDARLEPIHALTAKSAGFVLVHVGPIPWQDDTANGPARVGAVLEKHPGLTVVVAHMGVPETDKYLELTREHPNLYLDTTMAFTHRLTMRCQATSETFDAYQHNIVFGSDHPNLPHHYSQEVEEAAARCSSQEIKRMVFSENARQLLSGHL